jgi:hypothetical protein
MPIADPLVMPLARQLLDCYEQELAKLENIPEHIGLRPGTVVDFLMSTSDDECCEGLAWVRPAGFEPLLFQTDPVRSSNLKTIGWRVTLELGYVGCAPTPDENTIPSDAVWDLTTQMVMDAAAAMRRAVCCFIDMEPGRAKKVQQGTWQPVAVQGGCVGGTLPITVQGPACDCADAGPISS